MTGILSMQPRMLGAFAGQITTVAIVEFLLVSAILTAVGSNFFGKLLTVLIGIFAVPAGMFLYFWYEYKSSSTREPDTFMVWLFSIPGYFAISIAVLFASTLFFMSWSTVRRHMSKQLADGNEPF